MIDDSDWRLMGQENFLRGVALRRAKWAATRDAWDHDHCAFCQRKIWDRAEGDEATVAWTTAEHDDPARRR